MNSRVSKLAALPAAVAIVQSRSARKLIAASAIGLAMASCLAPSAQAGPLFDLHLVVPGPIHTDIVDSPAPMIQAIDGTDGVYGSGSAFGRAQLGNLGAKVTVVSTAPNTAFGAGAGAEVEYHDSFPIFIAGPTFTFDFLRITFSLDGSTSVSGAASSGVNLTVNGGSDFGSSDHVSLDGPGTTAFEVSVREGGDRVGLDVYLQVSGNGLGPASAIADFSQSSKISAVQLVDAQGNVIRDITLVDDAGNVLPISAVPEPASLMLLGIGALGLGIGRIKRRRTARHCECRPPAK